MSTSRPLSLATGRAPACGQYHPPAAGSSAATSVLVCPPWGWDEIASYRTRRRWAERLAAAGHPTLRFDLPGTGDSGGRPNDPGLVRDWLATIDLAAGRLRRESGVPRLALLGLGLGGLLAINAVEATAADDLILWGAPRNGRLFWRETRAFSALQDWDEDGVAEAIGGAGAIEAGGFLLSGDSKEELAKLNSTPPSGTHLRRALLLDRDGVAVEPALVESMEANGIDATLEPGSGWGVLVSHPERTRLPGQVAVEVERWLAAGEERESGAGTTAATAEGSGGLELEVNGATIRETPLRLELDASFPHAYGVLAEPGSGRTAACCAVFLNAGAIRHVGPNRLWVEAARKAAAAGIPSLRLDLEAIGEADGDEERLRRVGEFFVDQYGEAVPAALDELQRRGIAENFILIGLCAGAFWSFRAALEDHRVRSVLMLNSGALVWHPDLVTDRAIRELDRVRDPGWWQRKLRGQFTREGLRTTLGALLRKQAQLGRRALFRLRRQRENSGPDTIEFDLTRLRERGTRVLLAFSSGEDLHTELEEAGILGKLDEWRNTELVELPGADHSLRPPAAQVAARELIDREIHELARQADRHSAQESSLAG